MFESNTDFDFDEEIYASPFASRPKVEPTKRGIENETPTVETKKLCLDPSKTSLSSRSSQFLKSINGEYNKVKVKTVIEPQVDSSVINKCQMKPEQQLETKLQQLSSPCMRRVVSRKFPGPAGLLPEQTDLKIDIKGLEEMNSNETKQNSDVDMDVICSQMSIRAFQKGPWERMSRDFQNQRLFLPDKYNIAWINSRVKITKLIKQKAPFLAAIIQNIECLSLKTAVVTMLLKDATGQIHATIVHDLYEEYIKYLTVGSVVVLKQFSVLTTDHGSNNYLTITANNLVTIYSQDVSNDSNVHNRNQTSPQKSNQIVHNLAIEGNITVVTIQKFTAEDFMQNIKEMKSKYKAALLEQNLNFAMDFENIVSNLRSSPSVSCAKNRETETRTKLNLQRTVWERDNKFMSPNYKNLNTRSFSNSSINSDWNFVSTETATSSNNSSSNVCLNKENSITNRSHDQTRFNFKAHLNRNKRDELSDRMQLITEFSNGGMQQPLRNNKVSDENKSDKRTNVVTCSQISITSDNLEHSAILQNIFEGIDADSLFEDF